MTTHGERSERSRSGGTLIELMIAVTLFTVVLLASLAMIESGRNFSTKTMEITTVEDLAQQMLFRLEGELSNASGAEPDAIVSASLGSSGSAKLVVDSTVGFPPRGVLVMERGTSREERIVYDDLASDQVTFLGLTRGAQCTQPSGHVRFSELMWAGLAEPLVNQTSPSTRDYDGIALEDGGPVFFRGDGVGFSYRIPIDPTGGRNYVNGSGLNWGAMIAGAGPTLDGWVALYYLPKGSLVEALDGADVNGDGDTNDVFDVGQVRRVSWDTTDPTLRMDVGMGPSAILQERCNWGGDLDNDGFEDPIFLWNKDSNELHVRLFVLGRSLRERPIVRKVESVVFLRNEPEI